VGTLERPYIDSLWRHLTVLLGITLLGVLLVGFVGIVVAQRISRPVRAMAKAAQKVAQGDYSPKIEVRSSDEIGYLSDCFNRMTSELGRTQGELREWGEKLERKVEQRTAEIKAIQAQMLQAEKLAAIGKLAAGVAHEINNPLTGVLTNASLMLADTPPDDPQHPDLQTIVDETMRCRKIVKGLLEFARQAKPQTQLLDLNQVVQDVLGLVRNQASFRNIVVETALDPKLPPVMADRDQLRQVVLNMVLNAAEAMGQGGLLRLSTTFARDRGTCKIDIADSGPGIPEEMRARIFEPFFTTKKTGTGLGLAIAYGIVEEHKGTIQVESAPGKGTTMSVVLPSYVSANSADASE
jgi:two-component system NtrC family sensor kinase